MKEITEFTVLTRVTAELPDGFRITTDAFHEGWNQVLSRDVHSLDKALRKAGWHFIWIAEPSVRSGVGKTAQSAIAAAVKLALRRVWPTFNAANVDHIELTKYPWFFLARVRVYPYQIQQEMALRMSNEAIDLPVSTSGELMPITGSLTSPVAP